MSSSNMSNKPKGSLCLWILQVTAVFGLIVFFLYLTLRPSDPTYTIFSLTVDSNNNYSFGLDVVNENTRGGIQFEGMDLTLCAGEDGHERVLDGTTFGSFYLGRGKSIQWWQWFRGEDEDVVLLKIRLLTVVRYKILAWKTDKYTVEFVGKVPVDDDGNVLSSVGYIPLKSTVKKWRLQF